MEKENIAKNVIHIYKLAKLQENSAYAYLNIFSLHFMGG